MSSSGFGSMRHLAERFFSALSPAGPPASDESWARGWLRPGEVALWEQMSGPDRRHAVGVARDTVRLLAGDTEAPPAGREVIASALLHDVGKIESGFGTFARVAVTLAALGAGRDRLAAAPRSGHAPSHTRTRVRLYLTHDQVGGRLLRDAGSDPLTVAWAEQHHLPAERWSVARRVGEALKAADGD